MTAQTVKKLLMVGGSLLILWLAVRFLLPVAVPFLIGAVLAFAAEPGVRLFQNKMKWRRTPAVVLCVSLTLLLMIALLSVLGAAAVRELGSVAKLTPAVGQTVGQGMAVLEDYLVSLADRAPDNIRPMLLRTVTDTFQDGSALVNQVTDRIPGAAASLISHLSQGVLAVGTGILAGFMISIRLPKIKKWLYENLPQSWREKVLPAGKRVKKTFGRWLFAQLKLMIVTWAVVALGFTLIGISRGILWAALVALVDAVPVLGTGTILVPWALVRFLQGDVLQGAGLLATFCVAWLIRSVLEPRIVGKSLGLDPLISLMAFYVGFKLWGIPGMILAPMLAALIKSFIDNSQIFHKETS
ncbi:MAG: sporulation integral membrane protein YtvI [Oscillospiraceae bacterium]|nr:sporulation integral membrane protein YtvI [Oscillospiraceae bacterium]